MKHKQEIRGMIESRNPVGLVVKVRRIDFLTCYHLELFSCAFKKQWN